MNQAASHTEVIIFKLTYSLYASKVALVVKTHLLMQETLETLVRSLGQEDLLEEGITSPLQYSCLGNSVDRGAWQATVHSGTKSPTWLKQLSMHTHVVYTVINQKLYLFLLSSTSVFLASWRCCFSCQQGCSHPCCCFSVLMCCVGSGSVIWNMWQKEALINVKGKFQPLLCQFSSSVSLIK